MAGLPLWIVDAFREGPLLGNPAAVCVVEETLPEAAMQAIAAEMNLSETAFVRERVDGDFDLRWFTPKVEIALAGHPTLATAHVLASERGRNGPRFHTRSGLLTVESVNGGAYRLDLPTGPEAVPRDDEAVRGALGCERCEIFRCGREWLVLMPDEGAVRALLPDFRALASVAPHLVMATARADDDGVDFVSRVFAPAIGVDEDPVTGSAHCVLAPFWARRSGRTRLRARQLSARGGALVCEVRGERTTLEGRALTVLRGLLERSAVGIDGSR